MGLKGDPGEQGRDGVGLAGAVLDRDGALVVTLSDGTVRPLGVVMGAKGDPGRDGVDGLGFDDLVVEHDGERAFAIKFVQGDRVKDLGTFHVPMPIYRGVYQPGQTYAPYDEVTWGGSLFQAKSETSAKPGEAGEASRAWVLKVKRGSDGKPGPQGVQGIKGDRGDKGERGPDRW